MGTKPTKVLYVSHNHPAVRPGGAEQYALELYEALRAADDFEPFFLAWSHVPDKALSPRHTHVAISSVTAPLAKFFPFLIGFVADRFGLQSAMWVLLLGPIAILIGLPRQVSRTAPEP